MLLVNTPMLHPVHVRKNCSRQVLCVPGVPLAPSDILKVLLVSNKGKRETFPLLTVWNNCKVDLLKASQSLKEQRGRSFWGKVLASKVSLDDAKIVCCIQI